MKQLITIIALLSFGLLNGAQAQCPPGDVNLFNQSDIHLFVAAFPDCMELEGNLFLGKMDGSSDIYDLSELSMIKFVAGNVKVLGCPDLMTLNGLHNLEFVAGDVVISNCENLLSMEGFDKITEVGGNLSLIMNPALQNLDGFQNLKTINGNISLSYLDGLTSLQGLDNLETIGKDLSFSYTPSLLNMEGLGGLTMIYGSFQVEFSNQLSTFIGLDNLQMVGFDLVIHNNASLIRLDGLESLDSVGRDLCIGREYSDGISGNPNLSNLDGLQNLETIGRDFAIIDNDELTTLEGLASLHTIREKLVIRDNEKLSECAIEPICDFLITGGTADIELNATGCATTDEVKQVCSPSNTEDLLIREQILLQPNPAYGWVNVACEGPYTIEHLWIYHATGKQVLDNPNPAEMVDLSGLPAGLYLVRMQIDGKDYVERLMVQ